MDYPIYVYEFYVMDFGWDMFRTIPEMIEKLSRNQNEYHILQEFLSFCDLAKAAAEKAEITGGYSTEIHVMPLIDSIRPSMALIWKAGRGGWCIAVSEEELPWLENMDSCTIKQFNDL
jgi:hypothetical protein